MRKSLCRLLCCLMVICCACSMCVHAEDEGKPGDVDADGKVNATDALYVLQASVGLIGDSDFVACWVYGTKTPGDVNKDYKTNALDALLILQMSVGLIKEFPIATNPVKPTPEIWPDVEFPDGQTIYLPYDSSTTIRIAVDSSNYSLSCSVKTTVPWGWFGADIQKVSDGMYELKTTVGEARFDVPSVIEISIYIRKSGSIDSKIIGNVMVLPGRSK